MGVRGLWKRLPAWRRVFVLVAAAWTALVAVAVSAALVQRPSHGRELVVGMGLTLLAGWLFALNLRFDLVPND